MNTTELISPSPSERRTPGELFDELVPLVDVVAVAGPPVAFIAAPWLLLGLLLAAPFAAVFALGMLLAAATIALALAGAILATPFILVRHLRADWARHRSASAPAAQRHPVGAPRVAA